MHATRHNTHAHARTFPQSEIASPKKYGNLSETQMALLNERNLNQAQFEDYSTKCEPSFVTHELHRLTMYAW